MATTSKKEAIEIYQKNIDYWTKRLKDAQKEVTLCKNEISAAKEMLKFWKSK